MADALTRRQWLAHSGAALGALTAGAAGPLRAWAAAPPSPPVSIAKCASYADVVAQLTTQFDQIGGIGRVVRGKTVTMKLNLSGGGQHKGYTAGRTFWVHPNLVGGLCHLFGQAGARRIRIVEGARPGHPLEDKLQRARRLRPRTFAGANVNQH